MVEIICAHLLPAARPSDKMSQRPGSRRGRGKHSRGRAAGRGRGRVPGRSQDSVGPTSKHTLPSNAYRFEVEWESDDDAGIDFEEAAKASASQWQDYSQTLISDEEAAREFEFDISNLHRVFASVPLWVRIGDHSKPALGISESTSLQSLVSPEALDGGEELKKKAYLSKISNQLFEELDLDTRDYEMPATSGQDLQKKSVEHVGENAATEKDAHTARGISPDKDRMEGNGSNLKVSAPASLPTEPHKLAVSADDEDDFDKWLGDM